MKILVLICISVLTIQICPIRGLSEESTMKLNDFITLTNKFCLKREKLEFCAAKWVDILINLKIRELKENETRIELKKEQERLRQLKMKKKEEEKRLKELEKEKKILELIIKNLSKKNNKKFSHRF